MSLKIKYIQIFYRSITIFVKIEHEQHFTTASPCTATESIRHTQHGMTITFLKQLSKEERRGWREEESKEAAKRTVCEVESANANPTTNTIAINALTSYTAHDLSTLSLGT